MLSVPHLILIFIIALIAFGPEKLPQLARTLGKAMAEFRKVTTDLRRVVEDEMREIDRQAREAELHKRDAQAQATSPPSPQAIASPPAGIAPLPDQGVITGLPTEPSLSSPQDGSPALNTVPAVAPNSHGPAIAAQAAPSAQPVTAADSEAPVPPAEPPRESSHDAPSRST